MKITKAIVVSVISIILLIIMIKFEINGWPVGSSLSGLVLGLIIPYLLKILQDLSDKTDWMTTQRKLTRAKLINNDTIIRISFAYLFRIKIADKYLLVKNERGTGKYQPVGGVYQLTENEKLELKNLYKVKDDNKILIDESSRNDYRLRLENKYLRKFVKRFNHKAKRENIENLSREFKEELIDKDIVNWNEISYRYCGRHMTDLHWGQHFQCYELLLADVVELLLTSNQEKDLTYLITQNSSDNFKFATAEEIMALGININNHDLREKIADHTLKIIQENEDGLEKNDNVGKVFNVKF